MSISESHTCSVSPREVWRDRHTCCHQVMLMSLQGKGGYTELVSVCAWVCECASVCTLSCHDGHPASLCPSAIW